MKSSYLEGNMCWIYCLKQENWQQSHVIPLWHKAYILVEKANCLKTLRDIVGKMNYLTIALPNIAYFVSVVSQYMSSSTVDHWTAVDQILCYLQGAPDVVFYIAIMGIIDYSVSQMLIG